MHAAGVCSQPDLANTDACLPGEVHFWGLNRRGGLAAAFTQCCRAQDNSPVVQALVGLPQASAAVKWAGFQQCSAPFERKSSSGQSFAGKSGRSLRSLKGSPCVLAFFFF